MSHDIPVAFPSSDGIPVAAQSSNGIPVAPPSLKKLPSTYQELNAINTPENGLCPSSSQIDEGRKSKRLQNKPQPSYIDMEVEDIEDDSESEEMLEREVDSDEWEENENLEKINRRDWRSNKRFTAPLTDDEDEDSNELREERHESQRLMRLEIYNNLKGPKLYNKWNPDEDDEAFIRKYIVAPTRMQCAKFTNLKHTIPPDTMEKIKKGWKLEQSEQMYVSQTADNYDVAFRGLMFLIENQYRENFPEKLSDDGQLHCRQFVEFRSPKFISPFNIIDLLESECESPGVKTKMYLSYKCLVDQIFKVASSVIGERQFCQPLSDEEKGWDRTKQVDQGMKRQQELLHRIRNVQVELSIGKPFARWYGERQGAKKRKEEDQIYFEGRSLPDAMEVMSSWLNHPSTLEMDVKICEFAKSGKVVSGKELDDITKQLLIKMYMKTGARNEILRNIRWSDYLEGRRKGPCKYPFKPKDNARISPDDIINGKQSFAVVENPWEEGAPNSNDEATMDRWNFFKGICATVKHHKTGKNQPMYVWFSQVDIMYMMCYEIIVHNYAKSKGKSIGLNSPIFINSNFKSYMAVRSTLDLDDFSCIVGIPKCTTYIFRNFQVCNVYRHGTGKCLTIVL